MKRGVRLVSSVLATVLIATSIPFTPLAQSNVQAAQVVVTRSSFTSDDAYNAVMDRFDQNGDRQLDTDECRAIPEINFPNTSGFGDCSWINYCVNATSVTLNGGGVTRIDVSNLTNLQKILLGGVEDTFTSVDLSHNYNLTEVRITDTKTLTSVKLPTSSSITLLQLRNNSIAELDLSAQTKLTTLNVGFNNLTSLDVSNCTLLKELQCQSNNLTSLDITKCTSITSLYCYGNSITSINVYGNRRLTTISGMSYQQQPAAVGDPAWGASSGSNRAYIPVGCILYSDANGVPPVTPTPSVTTTPTVTTAPTRIDMNNVETAYIWNQTYTGYPVCPVPYVSYNGKQLFLDNDFTVTYKDNTNAGIATVILTGQGSYTGTKEVNFTIDQINIQNAKVTIGQPSVGANGEQLPPPVTVIWNDKTLVENQDYTLYCGIDDNGQGTISIIGKGNFGNFVAYTYEILTKDINDAAITLSGAVFTCYGEEVKPEVTVNYSGNKLTEGVDYTLAYSNNDKAGTASVTISGTGEYKGEVTKTFILVKPALIEDGVTVGSCVYTGNPVTPVVKVELDGRILVLGEDYTFTVSNNVNKGKGIVVVEGTGIYEGRITKEFDITAESILVASVSIENGPFVYTGKAINPEVTVKIGDTVLTEGKDYEVVYGTNIETTGTIVVKGMGNYGDSISRTFAITRATITEDNIKISNQVYTGTVLEPVPEVTVGDNILVMDRDFTVTYSGNKDAGTATATIEGIGNYMGKVDVEFTIAPYVISKDNVSIENTEFTYTGSEINPEVTIKVDSYTLIKDTDYAVVYSDNVNAGIAQVVITCTGNFSGEISIEYVINPKSISQGQVYVSDQTYTGRPLYPDTLVLIDGKSLVLNKDYVVEFSDNTNNGVAGVVVTGINNYEGEIKTTFKIYATALTERNVTVKADNYVYSGKENKPEVEVKVGNKVLTYGEDYKVSYERNIDAGIATVVVTGVNNYGGTIYKQFTISPLTIKPENISFDACVFTGSECTPLPVINVDGHELSENDYEISYTENTNVGQANVVITGKGNYDGTVNTTFEIIPAAFTRRDITLSDEVFVFNGKAQEPEVTVTLGGKALTKDADFQVIYDNNINASESAKVTIKGIGNYEGDVELYFAISPAVITAKDISISAVVYNGEAQEPDPVIVVDGITLVKDTDFTVEYSDNVLVGTAHASIKGIGNYTGEYTTSFSITRASMEDVSITIGSGPFTYTGEEICPDVAVKYGSLDLQEDKDYTIRYYDNLNAGMGKVVVVGNGNYGDTVMREFEILPLAINEDAITVSDVQYTGVELKPVPVITMNGVTLEAGVDFEVKYDNNINAGVAAVTIQGTGNYKGNYEKEFTVNPAPMSASTYTLSETSYVYSGKNCEPVVTVSYGNKTLIPGTDYTVRYEDNVNVGSAKVIITGAGNFTGTVSSGYKITAMEIPDYAVTISEGPFVYSGKSISPDVIVQVGGKILTSNDYIVTYGRNTDAGEAKVTIKGINNYTGTINKNFVINRAVIKAEDVEVASAAYTGLPLTPNVRVTVNGTFLENSSDYTLECKDNTEVGNGVVVITGTGNYEGEVTKTFVITAETLDNAEVIVSGDFVYNGSEHKPEVTLNLSGVTLVKDRDYKVYYKDNVNAGTALITVEGCGNYAGTKTYEFVINACDISSAVVVSGNMEYDGSELKPDVEVTLGDVTLKEGTDFQVKYSDNVNAGEGKIIVNGINNYRGTIDGTFTITPLSISGGVINVDPGAYTGFEVKPGLSLKVNDVALTLGKDYEAKYFDNINAGEAYVEVTGKGNYEGTLKQTYDIVVRSIEDATIGVEGQYFFTGDEIIPEVLVTLDGKVLVNNTDYILSFASNVEVGTAVITVTGQGNYGGVTTYSFSILPEPTPMTGVEGFCERLYTKALNRASDPEGIKTWVELLRSGEWNGAEVAAGFFFSPEFVNSNIDDDEYVKRLYRTFMDREPDFGGYNTWINYLADGHSREEVFYGFVNSAEWADICVAYGIESGNNSNPGGDDPYSRITAFATRLYTTCLGRSADPEGVKMWTDILVNQEMSGSEVAAGFFFSPEFLGKEISNEEYVDRLYRTFMDREADEEGRTMWGELLNSGKWDRTGVFNGFAQSNEFEVICSNYGIKR